MCYNEHVYRVSGNTHQFKEIMQAGLECVGDIDLYDIYETVALAAGSLALISDRFVLDVAHMGVLEAFLEEMGADESLGRSITACIAAKNRHELVEICRARGVEEEQIESLSRFIGIYGEMEQVLPRLLPLCRTPRAKEAYDQLASLAELLKNTPYANRIRFDFSIVNDMNYYNGVVFRGFLSGICEGVLAGGQYDKLLKRMGRRSGAVGFALYLDLLEELQAQKDSYDVDVLLLSDASTDLEEITSAVAELTRGGECVSVQKAIPDGLRYRRLMDLRKGERT